MRPLTVLPLHCVPIRLPHVSPYHSYIVSPYHSHMCPHTTPTLCPHTTPTCVPIPLLHCVPIPLPHVSPYHSYMCRCQTCPSPAHGPIMRDNCGMTPDAMTFLYKENSEVTHNTHIARLCVQTHAHGISATHFYQPGIYLHIQPGSLLLLVF